MKEMKVASEEAAATRRAEADAAATREDARALAARLQPLSIHGLRVSEQVIDGEDHMSLPYRIPSLVLEQVFSNRRR